MIRKIIHIDMDAFFAAVEQRDFPELKGKPVIVGGPPNSRGVVATCSYEARKYGIHSAMPSSHAYRLCPHAIFQPTRFSAYKEVSDQINEIFRKHTDIIEPMSLDEAYLDVTDSTECQGSATLIAEKIREEIQLKTRLTASAGVSFNKFLAKTASDINKPDGLTLIRPGQEMEFLKNLPVGKIYGVGKVTAGKITSLGFNTAGDLMSLTHYEMINHFGKSGDYYYNIIRGNDNREVETSRMRKSLGRENTFSEDLTDKEDMMHELEKLLDDILKSMNKMDTQPFTMTIKIKFQDFRTITRSISTRKPLTDKSTIMDLTESVLNKTITENTAVRLLGISFSHLKPKLLTVGESGQLYLDLLID